MKGVRCYLGLCLLLFVGAEAQAGPPAQRLGRAAPPPPATTTETVEAGHTNGGGGDGGAVMFPTGGAEIPGVGDPAYDTWARRFGTAVQEGCFELIATVLHAVYDAAAAVLTEATAAAAGEAAVEQVINEG